MLKLHAKPFQNLQLPMKRKSTVSLIKALSRCSILAVLAWAPALQGQMAAPRDHWVASWGAAQQLCRATGTFGGSPAGLEKGVTTPVAEAAPASRGGPQRRFGVPAGVPELNNQTIRMIARISLGGSRIRIRLSNALGGSSVKIGSAHVAIRMKDSTFAPGSDRVLTFSGKPTATLYAGQVIVSDPADLAVPALTDVAVSLYLPEPVTELTNHTFGLRPTYVSKEGNFAGAEEIVDANPITQYYWLAGIDVLAPANSATIVTFGDSITDGDQSTPDTNGMWPALLAARLQANRATSHLGVANAGISGNRILGDSSGDSSGGLIRLDHDALLQPGVKWITLLEGINDITRGARNPDFSADDLIAAYTQVIERAHLYGVRVIGCTLTPFGGSDAFTGRGEEIRSAANNWIRTSKAFDAVVDFDAETRDSADPTRFRKEADSPDMLHPGDAGYKLMAEAIDLSIFSKP
jgi:lysophospholipase L1-like esterase